MWSLDSPREKQIMLIDLRMPFKAEWNAAMQRMLDASDRDGRRYGQSRIERFAPQRRAFLKRMEPSRPRLGTVRGQVQEFVGYSEVVRDYGEWAGELTDERYRDVVQRARGVIEEGLAKGYTLRDSGWDKATGKYTTPGVLSRLEEVFGEEKTAYELQRIAVTEHTRASNMGARRAYQADPLVRGVIFVAIDDSRTSDVCRFLNGTKIAIDDPRLESVTPPLHVNCRSVLEPLFVWDEGEIDFDAERTIELADYDEETGKPLKASYTFRPSDVRRDFKGGQGHKAFATGQAAPEGFKPKTRKESILGLTKPMSRTERAKASHVAMTKEKHKRAMQTESDVEGIIKGRRLNDNEPFDVLREKDAVEVKTIFAGRNPKITMHKASLRRKLDEAKREGYTTHTVVYHEDTHSYYYARGLGSFRIAKMQKLANLNALADAMGAATL